MYRLVVAAATAVILAGCAGTAEDPTTPEATAQATRPPPATVGISPSPSHGTNGGLAQDIVDRAIDRAAEDSGVPADEIEVVTAESVTWSDGSLGCPEPGMGYTQALVPGYRVVLDVAGDQVSYHAAEGGDFFACANPIAPSDSR